MNNIHFTTSLFYIHLKYFLTSQNILSEGRYVANDLLSNYDEIGWDNCFMQEYFEKII